MVPFRLSLVTSNLKIRKHGRTETLHFNIQCRGAFNAIATQKKGLIVWWVKTEKSSVVNACQKNEKNIDKMKFEIQTTEIFFEWKQIQITTWLLSIYLHFDLYNLVCLMMTFILVVVTSPFKNDDASYGSNYAKSVFILDFFVLSYQKRAFLEILREVDRPIDILYAKKTVYWTFDLPSIYEKWKENSKTEQPVFCKCQTEVIFQSLMVDLFSRF